VRVITETGKYPKSNMRPKNTPSNSSQKTLDFSTNLREIDFENEYK
jgi:hypothetical protein